MPVQPSNRPEASIPELHTILDYIRWGASRFNEAGLIFGHGTDNALDEAAALVFHTLHQPYELPDRYLDAVLTLDERRRLLQLFERRICERKPAAYLINSARFAGLDFYVNESVLVPRSPIAELIETGFDHWVEAEQTEAILDLCTGCGCIAIACSYAFPDAYIDAVDISENALEVATINVRTHHVDDRVNVIQSDLYSALAGRKYDLIVCNPPYVNRKEWRHLPAEYKAEPRLGFDGGVSGLDTVKKVLNRSDTFLNDGGILVVEVGNSAKALQTAYPNVPFYWLEFERGGDGVFLLTKEQLRKLSC